MKVVIMQFEWLNLISNRTKDYVSVKTLVSDENVNKVNS